MPHEIHTSAQHLVAELDQADAQLVIDEWAGALAAGVIQRSPLGDLKALVARYRVGDMSGNANNRAAFGPIFGVTRE